MYPGLINCSTAQGFEALNREAFAFEVTTFRTQFSIMSYRMRHMKLKKNHLLSKTTGNFFLVDSLFGFVFLG